MANVSESLTDQKSAADPRLGAADWRAGIGIRTGLLAAFTAVAAIALLVAALAFYALNRVGGAMDRIVGDRLPVALETLHLGRQTDALVATAGPLLSAVNEAGRETERKRVDQGVTELRAILGRLQTLGAGEDAARILPIVEQLVGNLRRLDQLVRERASLLQMKEAARNRLLMNLQAFQSQLAHRIRLLEGDAAFLQRQLQDGGGDIPAELRRGVMDMAGLVPAAKLYADIEAVNGRLLAASEEPSPADVEVTLAVIRLKLGEIDRTIRRLDSALSRTIIDSYGDLRRYALAADGLPALRARELNIVADSRRLLEENTLISQSVNRAAAALVADSRAGVAKAATAAHDIRTHSLLALLAAVGAMLLGVALLMHFYVNRHLIHRLEWVSAAMRHLAAGQFTARLPPEGPDELGQLGRALRIFRDTAVSAEQRETELRNANLKANQALTALKGAQQDLIRQARTDFLTGLANRQHFMETAERAWERAQRGGEPAAILMIDIDHFKSINDTHGHLVGDRVLQHFSEVCSGALRPSDLLGRLGGEEFAAVLPGAYLSGAMEAAERVRAAVADNEIVAEGMRVRITVSIGVAISRGAGDPLDEAMARADAALYAAKQAGRNQVSA